MTNKISHSVLPEPHGSTAGIHTPLHTSYVGAPPEADGQNPHTGLHPTGSPPLSGCARPAWFPDGYRISVLPIVGPSTKPRGSGAPASILGLPDSGGVLAH